MGKKSQYDALFFDSYAYILSIHVFSLKNTLHSCLYFVNTAPFLSKTQFSHVIFFEIFKENPLLSRPYSVKKRQFCQNYPTLQTKEIRMPFLFSISNEKNTALMPIFCQENVLSPKNSLPSFPYFVKQNVHSLKITVL